MPSLIRSKSATTRDEESSVVANKNADDLRKTLMDEMDKSLVEKSVMEESNHSISGHHVNTNIDMEEERNNEISKVKTTEAGGTPNLVQRILTIRSTRSYPDPGPPPDGGWRAWLQVFQAHLCVFNSMGYASSYGLFVTHYLNPESEMFESKLARSDWAWPGALQLFLFLFLGALSGRLFDAGYYRHVLLTGFFFHLLGVFSTSFAKSYYQVLLAQGFVQGLGNGFIFAPSVGLISTYFLHNRAFAIALMASGSASGGLVFPLIAQQLLPRVGFAWTVRVMGFVMLANMVIIITLARTRIPPRRSGPLLEMAAWKEGPYVLFVTGMFCVFLGLYFAFSYINLYAQAVIHVDQSTSLTILLLLNVVGAPGRIFPALLSDRVLGPLNTLIPSILLLAILFFLWITVFSLPSLYAFVLVFGFVDGTVQGIFMGSMTSLTKDLSKIGTRVGMALTVLSFATLGGIPIAGRLVDADGGSFLYTQIFGGMTTLVGLVFVGGCRYLLKGWKKEKV